MRNIDASLLDYSSWPEVDVASLSTQVKERYLRLRKAICAYIDGVQMKEYCVDQKLCRKEIWRSLTRCVTLHTDGRPYGFRALMPHSHVHKCLMTKRIAENKAKGERDSFRMLVDSHPNIFEKVDAMYLKRPLAGKVQESRMEIKSIHLEMLKMLRMAGVDSSEYPFNVKGLGTRSMSKYLKKLHEKNIIRSTAIRMSSESARRLLFEMNSPQNKPKPDPYQIALADGHRLDAKFAVELTTPEGDILLKPLDRLWIFVIMDEASRAILGYHLSLEREYTQEDVLRAIHCSLVPWKPKKLTIKGLEYIDGAGLPNGVIPELTYATWQEFRVDNAKANLSISVKNHLHEIIGCSTNPGPVKMPERRSILERFFGTLEKSGFHRLPSTTGSHPSDVRRKKPEEKAVEFEILLSEMEEILDVLIANYNATPNSGRLCGRTPLEVLRQYVNGGGIITRISESILKNYDFMTIRVNRTVRGGGNTGRSPHIFYEGVIYSNDVLRRSPQLEGEQVSLCVNVEDLRQMRVFLSNGEEFGMLTAQGSWGIEPHDLRTRKAINRLKWEGKLDFYDTSDVMVAYHKYLHEKLSNKKSGRTVAQLEKMRRKQTESEALRKPTEDNNEKSTAPHLTMVNPESKRVKSLQEKTPQKVFYFNPMKKSQTRPEIQGGLHPINTGKYMFLTTAINELSEQVNLWVSQRTTGAMIVGDQRLGKTRARVCIKRQLLEIYPQIPVIEIPCRHEKNPTERNFFMHLLECADHSVHEIKRRDSSLLRHRLNEYLKAQVEPSPQKLVIFLLDDAQTLSECQYTWLMDIHNEMNNVGIHLGCYLFGQKELIHQRTAFRMANKHQLIARFMLRSFNFHGIRNFDELLYCLKGYDETECPPGSGWSFTRYFFPESFNDGWRVISLGETLWNAFFDASKSETKTKQIEIPMEFFVRVINQFFLENKDRNVLINPMTFTEIMKIIENTGFYEFRDGIPSEILHDSGSK